MTEAALFRVHSGLAREAPGSEASTLEALRRLPVLPPKPRIMDLGCGPGASTLVLAREFKARIVAVDTHQPYLDALQAAASAAGLDQWIETRCVSMDALPDPARSYDLLWSEGAAYCIGLSNALRTWRPLLKPGGLLAYTELTWLTESPPEPVRLYFERLYPPMTTVAGNRRLAEEAGYEVLDSFPLPAEDWWAYYSPLQARVNELRGEAETDAELAAEIRETDDEIATYAAHGDSYGYVFYLLRKPA